MVSVLFAPHPLVLNILQLVVYIIRFGVINLEIVLVLDLSQIVSWVYLSLWFNRLFDSARFIS